MKKNQPDPLAMTASATCHCHSGRPYAECCGPLLSGDRIANTAEALMRSRYSAYVVRDIAYLLRSWHSTTRPAGIDPAAIPEWLGLQIVRTEKGLTTDHEGVVEFEATACAGEKVWRLHEVSRFVQEDGQWFYVDGDLKNDFPAVKSRGAKVGRNDPCPCGSGRKFKKCCGL